MAVSKPLPGQPIDPASPWARGLFIAALFNEGGGKKTANLASYKASDAGTGTAVSWVGGNSGVAAGFNGSTSTLHFPNPAASLANQSCTVVLRFRLTASPGGAIKQIYGESYSGRGSLYITFNAAGSSNQLCMCVNGALGTGLVRTSRNFANYLNQWFTVVCTYDATAGTQSIYVDGVSDTVFVNASARTAINGTGWDVGSFPFFGSRYVAADFDAIYHYEARSLSASEAAALTVNPWALWPDESEVAYTPTAPTPVPFYYAPQPAVSKPLPGQQIDRTAPAAQGIQSAWPFNEGGGSRINDVVGSKNATGAATAVTWNGSGAVFNGSTSLVRVNNSFNIQTSSRFTVLLQFSSKSASAQVLIGTWASGIYAGWTVYLGPNLVLAFINQSSTVNFLAYTNTTYDDGKLHTAVISYDGSGTTAGIKFAVDGAQVAATQSTLGGGLVGTFSGPNLDFGYNAGTPAYRLTGTLNLAALWVSTLSPSTAVALSANPWQLWPDDQIVFAPETGINITPDPATLTLTGYAPTVTAPAAVTPTPASLTLTGYAPTVTAPASITPTPATLTLTGYPPTVTTSAATNDSDWLITARRRGRR